MCNALLRFWNKLLNRPILILKITFSSATFANRSRNLAHIEKWQIVREFYVILYTNRIKWQFYQICNQTILLNDYVLIDRYVQFSQKLLKIIWFFRQRIKSMSMN